MFPERTDTRESSMGRSAQSSIVSRVGPLTKLLANGRTEPECQATVYRYALEEAKRSLSCLYK